MGKKEGLSGPERQADSSPAPAPVPTPAVVKFSVSKKTYQDIEAVRRWETRSASSDIVLSGRLRREECAG